MGRRRLGAALVALFCVGLLLGVHGRSVHAAQDHGSLQAHDEPPLDDPDLVCADCHAALVARYKQTAMGAGSGEAMAGLLPGSLEDPSSGVAYRVFRRDGRAWMSFSRGGDHPVSGKEQLLYFIGSGRHGRTYLYRQGDAWFELPINWYTPRSRWDMAPAFEGLANMPRPLPVDSNCLHCHATEVQTALPEAHNRFPTRPFNQGGIGCSACHGDPTAHLQAQGRGPILNPAKLGVAARDSTCIQCHLEGDAVVYRPGRSLAAFQPGDNLSDFAVYFVRASQTGGGQRATSQYEALLKSACKRSVGDALTCTTCHDPHSAPAPAQRVAYYRDKCLQCHNTPAIAEAHHPEQPDCAACHMPSRKTADISHQQVTDHDIERSPSRPDASTRPWIDGETLVPVGSVVVGDRELGLAYAQRAQKGDRVAGSRALLALRRAEGSGSNDLAVHVNLGWLEQMQGDLAAARHEYALALQADPYNASALVNRAVLDARAGDLAEAVRLLDRLLRADSSQTLAGVDLLRLECHAGETARAAELLQILRAVHPDAPELQPFASKTCP